MSTNIQLRDVVIAKEFIPKILPIIDSAKQSIDIVVYDWRWYKNQPGCPVQLFNQAIVRAIRRGVKVRAVVNFKSIVAPLRAIGCEVKNLTTDRLVHSKLMILDQNVVVIGSHNYTQHAFTRNLEISVVFSSAEPLADFIKYFDYLWQ